MDSEFRVKMKKYTLFSGLLGILALVLTSCLFESDDTGLNSWLSDHGMPIDYKVKTLSVDGLVPVSSEVFLDTSAHSADAFAVLGKQSGLVHDLVFDFAFHEKDFFEQLKKADSAASFIALHVLRDFYNQKGFPRDSFPLKEELNVNVSWIMQKGSKESFIDSIGEIKDSVWFEDVANWTPDTTVDTSYSISLGKKGSLLKGKDTILRLDMPSAFVERLKKVGPACRLQLRMSAPEASRLYRFYGAGVHEHSPFLRVRVGSDLVYKDFEPFRMANIFTNTEDGGLVLHGGVVDSLVVEYPSADILKALSEFYGDEFPFSEGEGNDVRQAVFRAQMTFARDDSQGNTELGLPIQVLAASFIDSAQGQVRRMESYVLDSITVRKKGHQNLVFHDGDSLTLQVTYGIREFINKASDGRTFKMMFRLGRPFMQEKMTVYRDTIIVSHDTVGVTAAGKDSIVTKRDTVLKYFPFFDYAKYDFATSMKNPATLKIWLASKRGDE